VRHTQLTRYLQLHRAPLFIFYVESGFLQTHIVSQAGRAHAFRFQISAWAACTGIRFGISISNLDQPKAVVIRRRPTSGVLCESHQEYLINISGKSEYLKVPTLFIKQDYINS